MHSFIGVIVCLELFVAASWGRTSYVDNAKSCEFPHKGDGGVLDENQVFSSLSCLDPIFLFLTFRRRFRVG